MEYRIFRLEVIHAFGAYFGLAVAWVLYNTNALDHKDEAACYSSDLFSLTGAPGFGGSVLQSLQRTLEGDPRVRRDDVATKHRVFKKRGVG